LAVCSFSPLRAAVKMPFSCSFSGYIPDSRTGRRPCSVSQKK
jgi:hypothetical protein